jgi:hypothetical protein
MIAMSKMSGTLRIVTGSCASNDAASTGRASFLLPDGVMLPERGNPHSTINFCIYFFLLIKIMLNDLVARKYCFREQ